MCNSKSVFTEQEKITLVGLLCGFIRIYERDLLIHNTNYGKNIIKNKINEYKRILKKIELL
ncbi:MAG: hypothetical protein ACOC1K_05270 [Nanoarchaeota archaeon]